jgi:hypothetical protein
MTTISRTPNILLYIVTYYKCYMSSNILLEKGEEKEQEQQSQLEQGVPVCGANLSSPVVDQANYIGEIHYKIGNRVYIENAD